LALVVLGACGDDAATPVSMTAPSTPTITSATSVPPTTEAAAPAPPGGGLEVLVVGDSVMHDAYPGIAAALEATGHASSREATAFGLGFSHGAAVPLAEGTDDLLAGPPAEQVVVMVGSWDHMIALRCPEAYAEAVRAGLQRLAAGGRRVLLLGEPPSDPAMGEDADRARVNQILEQEAAEVDGVRFAATDTVIGDDEGRYQQSAGGHLLRKPDGRHLCPDGAVRFGQGVVDLLGEEWALGAPQGPWQEGAWRNEARYDDPPGGCDPA
jgi:hypothetical protein